MAKTLLGAGILLALDSIDSILIFCNDTDNRFASFAGACLGDFGFTGARTGSDLPLLFLIIMVRCSILAVCLFLNFPSHCAV